MNTPTNNFLVIVSMVLLCACNNADNITEEVEPILAEDKTTDTVVLDAEFCAQSPSECAYPNNFENIKGDLKYYLRGTAEHGDAEVCNGSEFSLCALAQNSDMLAYIKLNTEYKSLPVVEGCTEETKYGPSVSILDVEILAVFGDEPIPYSRNIYYPTSGFPRNMINITDHKWLVGIRLIGDDWFISSFIPSTGTDEEDHYTWNRSQQSCTDITIPTSPEEIQNGFDQYLNGDIPFVCGDRLDDREFSFKHHLGEKCVSMEVNDGNQGDICDVDSPPECCLDDAVDCD